MRNAIAMCLAVVVLISPAIALGQSTSAAQTETDVHVRKAHPNLIGGELGGRAIIYSLTYERFIVPQFGLGVGLMGIGTSDGAVAIIPLHASLVPFGNVHSLYLSGGVSFAVGADNWDEVQSASYGTATIGYLYQSYGGFFVRPSINLLFRSEDFLILPGIQFGGSF